MTGGAILLPAADRVARPWKNGGGTTTEVAVAPAGAGLDHFDWRVSIAEVASDGPFSVFPGIDRIIAILDGAGLDLAVEGRPVVRLDPGGEPHAFPGDAPTAARLVAGPIRDLNLMVRRGRPARMRRLDLQGPAGIAAGPALLLWAFGSGEARTPAGAVRLGPLDAVLAERAGAWLLRPDGEARVYLMEPG